MSPKFQKKKISRSKVSQEKDIPVKITKGNKDLLSEIIREHFDHRIDSGIFQLH